MSVLTSSQLYKKSPPFSKRKSQIDQFYQEAEKILCISLKNIPCPNQINKYFSRLSNNVMLSRYSLPRILFSWWWTKTPGNWPQPALSRFTENMRLLMISGKGMNKETPLKSAQKKYGICLCSFILKTLDAGTLLFLSSRPGWVTAVSLLSQGGWLHPHPATCQPSLDWEPGSKI